MEEDAKIAAQKSGRLSFYVVNAIADGCTEQTQVRFFDTLPRTCKPLILNTKYLLPPKLKIFIFHLLIKNVSFVYSITIFLRQTKTRKPRINTKQKYIIKKLHY